MIRHLYIVCYDIRNDARLGKVLRKVAEYAGGGQKSVKECWLDNTARTSLTVAVLQLMDRGVDRFLLVRFDPRMVARELGRAAVASDGDILVLA